MSVPGKNLAGRGRLVLGSIYLKMSDEDSQ